MQLKIVQKGCENMKKIVSVLLCAAMFVASAGLLMPSAAPAEPCDCDMVPVIRFTGGHGALVENYGTPEEKYYYGVDMLENLERDFLGGMDDLTQALLTLNPSKILDAFLAMCYAWIGPLAMNPDGSSVKALGRYDGNYDPSMKRDHKVDRVYTFTFDWRLSPFDIIDEFNDYVQMIKADTGHEHVHIQSISGSGSVLLAYVDKYVNGLENPDALSILMGQSTGFGANMIANFLNADYSINPKNMGTLDYLYAFDLVEETNDTLLTVFDVLYKTGALDVIAAATALLPEAAFDRIYETVTRSTYAAWPGMWAWCPPEAYESAKARLTNGHPEYEELGFLEKIDRYHDLQLRAAEVLQEASKKIKVANMVGYDIALIPLGKTANDSSDAIVAVKHASLGAIAAPFGKTLGKNYKQAVDDGHNHLSPDGKIDASTCALPEYTWFMNGAVHRGIFEYGGWYNWWRDAPKGKDTVFDNPDWPQFIQLVDKAQNDRSVPMQFVPVTAEPESFADIFWRFWDEMLAKFRTLLERAIAPWTEPVNKYFWSIWF